MPSKNMRSKTRKNRYLYKLNKSRRIKKGGKPPGFKKAQCAPNKNDKMNKYTCYSEKDLIKMKNLWNARHRDMPISDTMNFTKNNAIDNRNNTNKWKYIFANVVNISQKLNGILNYI